MSIVYMQLSVSIHGLNIDDQEMAENFLIGWIKAATRAGLTGNSGFLFGFRDELDDDIVVEVEEHAGDAGKGEE